MQPCDKLSQGCFSVTGTEPCDKLSQDYFFLSWHGTLRQAVIVLFFPVKKFPKKIKKWTIVHIFLFFHTVK